MKQHEEIREREELPFCALEKRETGRSPVGLSTESEKLLLRAGTNCASAQTKIKGCSIRINGNGNFASLRAVMRCAKVQLLLIMT